MKWLLQAAQVVGLGALLIEIAWYRSWAVGAAGFVIYAAAGVWLYHINTRRQLELMRERERGEVCNGDED